MFVCMYVFCFLNISLLQKIRNVYVILQALLVCVELIELLKSTLIHLHNYNALKASLAAAFYKLFQHFAFIYYVFFIYKYFKKNLMTFMHTNIIYHWLKSILKKNAFYHAPYSTCMLFLCMYVHYKTRVDLHNFFFFSNL